MHIGSVDGVSPDNFTLKPASGAIFKMHFHIANKRCGFVQGALLFWEGMPTMKAKIINKKAKSRYRVCRNIIDFVRLTFVRAQHD